MARAGFGIRLGAFILDGIIYGFASWLLGLIINLVLPTPEPIDPVTGEFIGGTGMLISMAISLILAFVYFVVIPYRKKGKTIGKMITRIRVSRLNEDPLTLWTLFLREFIGKTLSSIPLMIGYLLALGRQKRALHDYVAGTVVLKDKD